VQEKSALIENHLHLVVNAAKKYNNTRVSVEDIISIGTIGLIVGENSYDNSEKTELTSHLSFCIENEISKYFRMRKIKKAN